jgi:hypothetical protein
LVLGSIAAARAELSIPKAIPMKAIHVPFVGLFVDLTPEMMTEDAKFALGF